jgi:hypothetical protein
MITQGATLVEEANARLPCSADRILSFGTAERLRKYLAAGWEFFSARRRGSEEAASAMKRKSDEAMMRKRQRQH